MDYRLRAVRDALMVHFIDSPASRNERRVEVRASGGFEIDVFVGINGSLLMEVRGEPADKHITGLARANNLLSGALSGILPDDLRARVLADGSEHEHVKGHVRRAYDGEDHRA